MASRNGIALIEVLITAVVVGIAAMGIALMFGTGSGWVAAGGDNRVALKLAQQKVEQLRSMTFGCIYAGHPQTYPNPPLWPLPAGCAAAQNYNEGPTTWVTASGLAAPRPTPATKFFTRQTCVQYVSDTDFSSPAYTGGASPTAATCPPGNPTNTKRIVVVVKSTSSTGEDRIESEAPVILQAWITSTPGGI